MVIKLNNNKFINNIASLSKKSLPSISKGLQLLIMDYYEQLQLQNYWQYYQQFDAYQQMYYYQLYENVFQMPHPPSQEKASLMDLVRLMDHIQLNDNYKKLGSASKLYRDWVVMKLFQLIAGKKGNIEDVMHRWYNNSDFFKDLRKARDEKHESLYFYC
jgi:hypothetical protein